MNGHFAAGLSRLEGLPKGVRVLPLEEALEGMMKPYRSIWGNMRSWSNMRLRL